MSVVPPFPAKPLRARVVAPAALLWLFLATVPINPALADEDQPVWDGTAGDAGQSVPEAAAESQPGIEYTVELTGVDDGELKDLLQKSSQLIALKGRPPVTVAALARRAEDDLERFDTVLRSEGFYDATTRYRIDDQVTPVSVDVTVSPGPAYRLEGYEVVFVGHQEPPPEPIALKSLGLELGMKAQAGSVVTAQKKLVEELQANARPLAEVVDRKVTVDHATRTMSVVVKVDPGPRANFGPVTFDGLERVKEDYLRTLVPWSQGQPYDQRKVAALRAKLLKTGLFSTVATRHGEELDAAGEMPMEVRLIEGKRRSVGVGLAYSTSEGPLGKAYWEHRNLFGRNEDLRITAEVGQITQKLETSFLRPDFRRPRQDLLADVTALHTNSKAFNEVGVSAGVKLRRPLDTNWKVSLGPTVEWSELEEQQESTTSTLLGLPGTLSYDGTDNNLNPTEGARFRWAATPYTGWFDEPVTFLVNEVGGSTYLALDDDRRFILAGRGRVGSIVGESRRDIPPNKRFYAGGGGSIRGYDFQKVGPLNDENDPIGGRSLIEVGAELRMRVWGNFGVVPFVDGGNVFEEVYPDFSEQLRWAAGLGLRYHTPVGPLRFDIAFPLDRRKGIDNAFQFYISIGQAF